MKSDFKKDTSALFEAVERDKQMFAELEKTGKLHKGYDPAMRALHEQNAVLLEQFFDTYGWPIPSQFGGEVHEAAWFIAIHAISKPHILKRALHLLEQALHNGEQVAQEYAKLFDRIELYEGRKQRYGTQFAPSPAGWYAWDLEDPEQVDVRRAALGLSTFLEGKEACGAGEGGFISQEEQDCFEADFLLFLQETGWRS